MSGSPGTLLVVSHAHWDREWYRTAEAFRARLVPLVDEVLERGGPFLLDGQGIVLDDYLAWQPGQRVPVAAGLRAGAVEAGPWYVLADNLIPSGEAMVRNLLAGRAALGGAGGRPLPVLYCPDTFGHPAAGPLLAAGFGLAMAVVWRGYGGRGWPAGDTARWRFAGGEEVQLYHLPPSGYEHGASLPATPDEARERWREIRATLAARAAGRTMLVLNGADHHAMQRSLDEALLAARAALPADDVRRATLRAFAEARRAETAGARLPVVQGELRHSPSYVWALPGTLASRASQKRANASLERLLVREVEPWHAMAWWTSALDLGAAERALWRLALENHPHDTLCGCSIDAVAAAMDDRVRRANKGAQELRRLAVEALAGIDADAARAAFTSPARSVVITNPVPWTRTGVVEVTLDIPLAIAAVGPGSGSRQGPARGVPPVTIGSPPMPSQRLTGTRAFALHESPRHYPVAALVQRESLLLWATDLMPLGLTTIPVHERRTRPRAFVRAWASDGAISNGSLTIRHDTARGLRCESPFGVLDDLLGFESVGERGDLYTHSPIPGTHTEGRCRRQRLTMRGPLRAELTLTFEVPVAARALTTALGEPVSRRAAVHRVRVRIQLEAGAAWFRVLVDGDNRADDHRLRVLLRTGCKSGAHAADAAFGEVRRSSREMPPVAGDVEAIPPTAPLHRYVSLYQEDGGRGVSVISDGLAEYQASADGVVAVTLIRAVGELSRADLPERPGHAGWPSSVPGAQSRGPWQAALAVMPHGPRTAETAGAIARTCDDFLVPPRGHTAVGQVASARRGLALEGAALTFLSCKRSEDGASIVVRCLNRSSNPAPGAWCLPGLRWACLARLDETPLGHLPVREDRVRFEVPPHAVSTILLRRA